MAYQKNDVSENLPTPDQAFRTSSSPLTQRKVTTARASETLSAPVEYVSLFEGVTDTLKRERDSTLDPYLGVFTGFNKLLVEVAHYVKEKGNPPEVQPRQMLTRLM